MKLLPEQFKRLLDCIADGMFSVDLSWRITSFNRAAEEITGISKDDALGHRCCEVFKANICERDCALKQTMATNRPVINKKIYIVNKRGERIPVTISTAILYDADGNVIGGVETFRDLSQMEALKKELHRQYSFRDIISRNPQMMELFEILPEIAQSDVTILVSGESGTGKELVARAIHDLSLRRNHPFIAVNCGAIPETLMESELFGYRKGAFTGAQHHKPGRFKLADKGTLFLDEISELSLTLQVKLLRAIETKKYEPLGAVSQETADVRIVTATNKNLEQLVNDGGFREDLYYRVNVISIELPPLRDRLEDIPLLVDFFIQKFNSLQHKSIEGISDDALSLLMRYDYPGNVRELQNFVERAFVLCRGDTLEKKYFPEKLHALDEKEEMLQEGSLSDVEAAAIKAALRRHGGRKQDAARELGIHRTTLYRKMKFHGIDVEKE
ncbi:sigma 54-interacting transcriptional regulator [bacterium]|nr:sigma 54-interacting transcriptional regulator [candidate division CSSED10-310 bacterium]